MTNRSPDVRFISRKWPPAVGGMETYSERLTAELGKRTSLDLIVLPGRRSGEAPTALAMIGFALRTAGKLISRPQARIVHVGDLASWPFGWVASCRHPRSRIVISAHGSDVSFAQRRGWRATLYRHYLRLGARLLDGAHVIANSSYVAGLAEASGFRRVSIIPLATDLGANSDQPRSGLLYAGRISRAKGLRFLVEDVLPLLPQDVILRVAGTVWEERELELLSNPRVDYLGVLSPSQLAGEYGAAAAVLIPTRESEGFGLVAVEAAACGAFVIASRHSGLQDIVRPPIGICVPANGPAEWAAAIEGALAMTPGDRVEQAARSRAIVAEKYRWSQVADATWAIYDAA